jgi:hypothetical protein
MTRATTYLHDDAPRTTVDDVEIVGTLPLAHMAVPGGEGEIVFIEDGVYNSSSSFAYDSATKTLTLANLSIEFLSGINVYSYEIGSTSGTSTTSVYSSARNGAGGGATDAALTLSAAVGNNGYALKVLDDWVYVVETVAGISTNYDLWHEGNDGAGSGLDADLLDGANGAAYLARANHTGTQTLATISDAGTMAAQNANAVAITGGTAAFTASCSVTVTRASGANTTPLTLADTVTGVQTAGFGQRITWTSNAGGTVASIGFEVGGDGTNNQSQIGVYTQNAAGGLTRQVLIDSTGSLAGVGSIKSSHATAGIGYATGAGGTVTQATNKTTAVTLNKATGTITLAAGSMAAGAIISFTFNNSAIAATDQIVMTHHSVGTFGAYTINCRATGAGTASVAVRNNTAGALNEQPVLRFFVNKSVDA